MSDTFCQACKCFTEVVVSDHATGGTSSCSECGTVVVDEVPEWVSVPDREDPTREPSKPVGPESGVSGSNGAAASDEEASPARRGKRRRRPRPPPFDGFGSIAAVSDRLGIVAAIKDRANEIYKKVVDQKPLKFRTPDAVVAACVYIACRQENKPRTVKEMCSANGATKKEVARAKDFIMKYLETEGQEIGTIHAADFLRRFCSVLGMSNIEVMAAQETVKKSEELVLRRSPISVAAVVIYIITQLSNDKKGVKDIAFVTRVAEATIKNSYKDLYPHLSEVIPTWFAKEEDLRQLPPA
ncbi:transcription initiation factor IIB-2-like [Rosa sericea]